MQYSIFFSLLIFSFLSVASQENFRWKEMNDFHATAMSSFHSAEVDKLQPVRDRAGVILEKAKEWQASTCPVQCNPTVIIPLLRTLVGECQAIYDAVAEKKPDKTLKPLVEKAHSTFHLLIDKCK